MAALTGAFFFSCPAVVIFRLVKEFGGGPERSGRGESTWFGRLAQDLRDTGAFTRALAALMLGPVPKPIPVETVGRPVIPVHGLGGHATNWNVYGAEIQKRGRAFYPRTLGVPLLTLEAYTERLEKLTDDVLARHPEAEGFDLLGHSMGGIVVRDLLTRRPDLAARVHTIVTAASPHGGTDAARWFPLSPSARLLSPESERLKSLPSLRALAPRARILTLVGEDDPLVYPLSAALAEGTEQRTYPNQGHFTVLYDPHVVREVVDYLVPDPESPAGGATAKLAPHGP